ncbi:acyl-CoA dehydrogenase family protein [Nocardioides acrostichi]|uniref:Acyl-CoA dehydrogenase family protein n=1 Tax=Nocardioides acrostichi TaxID=2784339 RepID=A0A930V3A0_9ACTN|nr:acyl-CoA dehydrogenase family protein [Nocardioides acrostichi]MBF4162945.1 acyl-CoA dehydrogenase family protein [Nocardioides acrostichi]
MDFTYDDEQESLRDAVRGLLGKAYSDFEQRRQTTKEDPGFSEKTWRQMAEMGLLGLPFSEDDGGVGAGPVEIGIVCQEIGRVIAPEPYLPVVVLAGGLVQACGTPEQRAEVLGGIASGEQVVAFAHDEPGSRWAPAASGVTASESDGSWTLTGTKEPVVAGERADALVVTAALPGGGTGAFLVQGADAERTGYATYDGGRAARVVLDGTAATPLGEPGTDLTASIGTVLDIGRIMAGNIALGAMQTALRSTTEYLKSRKQFGVTLNTFQALTFRSADMYISLELASSMVQWATMVIESGDADAVRVAAARCGVQVSRSSRHIGQEAIQLHGGIGMTAEYSVGSYTAVLTMLDHLLGDGDHHVDVLAAGVLDHGSLDPLAMA